MDTSEVQQALGSIISELESLKLRNASLEREVATLRAERTVSPVRPKSDIALPEHTDNSGQGPQGAIAAPQVVSRR